MVKKYHFNIYPKNRSEVPAFDLIVLEIMYKKIKVKKFCVVVAQVSLLVRRELYERAKDFNIILDDVSITELSFSSQYTAAVEAKQVGKNQLTVQ